MNDQMKRGKQKSLSAGALQAVSSGEKASRTDLDVRMGILWYLRAPCALFLAPF
jgi:hypothetical protein